MESKVLLGYAGAIHVSKDSIKCMDVIVQVSKTTLSDYLVFYPGFHYLLDVDMARLFYHLGSSFSKLQSCHNNNYYLREF